MITPKLRPVLLSIFTAMAVLGAVLLVFSRDPSGAAGAPESCGPQELVITETHASVDPAGCEVQLVVWEAAPDAVEWCKKVCAYYPQINPVIVTGTGPLSADLPCGSFQVDVFDTSVELPAVLTREYVEALPESWFDNLLAWEVGTRVCEPVTPPVTPPAAPPAHRTVAPAAAPVAVPVIAQPTTAG